MILDFEPGDKVINPDNNEWGIGQVQSVKRVQWLLKIPKRGKDWNDLIVSCVMGDLPR